LAAPPSGDDFDRGFLGAFFYIFIDFLPPERMDVFQRVVIETTGPLIKALRKCVISMEETIKE